MPVLPGSGMQQGAPSEMEGAPYHMLRYRVQYAVSGCQLQHPHVTLGAQRQFSPHRREAEHTPLGFARIVYADDVLHRIQRKGQRCKAYPAYRQVFLHKGQQVSQRHIGQKSPQLIFYVNLQDRIPPLRFSGAGRVRRPSLRPGLRANRADRQTHPAGHGNPHAGHQTRRVGRRSRHAGHRSHRNPGRAPP